MMRYKLFFIQIMVVFLLVGCIKMETTSGYAFDEKKLAKIEIGKTRKAIVKRILGSPSITSDYGDNSWFYVFRNYERIAFLDAKLKDQRVIKITFNDDTTVNSIIDFSKEEAQTIALDKDETPITSSDLTVIEQLLGNVGRFSNGSGPLRRVPGN